MLPEAVKQNIMTYSNRTEAQVEAETESASDFTWDCHCKIIYSVLERSNRQFRMQQP